MKRRVMTLALGFLAFGHTATAADQRADVVVYGDHQPPLTRNGAQFVSPFVQREDLDPPVMDPETRIRLEVVPGLKNPKGSVGWGIAAWGKYVLFGNYDEGISFFGQMIDDQRIGIFDTESKNFCQLDLAPGSTNAGVENIVVADPGARRTRLYFQGIGGLPGVFGYIEGDLDAADPCSQWPVTLITHQALNAASPPFRPACQSTFCGFDGMALLKHDTLTDTQTLVLHNWNGLRIAVVRVDGQGTLSVPAVYMLPLWKPPAANGACFHLRPVILPAVDPTKEGRFASGFDITCTTAPGEPDCAPYLSMCPGTGGASCSPGETCPQYYCSSSYAPCTPGAPGTCLGQGSCINSCASIHPGRLCSASGAHCAYDTDCPPGCPGGACILGICLGGTRAGLVCESCLCGSGQPIQEFQFNEGTTTPPTIPPSISTTSALFQTSTDARNSIPGSYTDDGALWVHEYKLPFGNPNRLAYFAKTIFGERAYYKLGDPAGTEAHTPSVSFIFEASHFFTGRPHNALQVGQATFFAGRVSVQRALKGFQPGTWVQDTSYKTALGADILPAEPRRCTAGTNADAACTVNQDCPGGTCQVNELAVGEEPKANLAFGGSPPSLWGATRWTDLARKHGDLNAYLHRIPVWSFLPGTFTPGVPASTRPGTVWTSNASCATTNCDRLWVFAEHDGVLSYRTRDDGVWGAWFALPANVTLVGGVSPVTFDGTVEVFGRASDGLVYSTQLTSALDCSRPPSVLEPSPPVCTWAQWTAVPGSPVTDREPAATVYAIFGPYLAVRRMSDGKVAFAFRNAGTWTGWNVVPGTLVTDAAPAIAWNPGGSPFGGSVWIVVRDQSDGSFKYTSILWQTASSWTSVPGTGAVLPWATAPGAVWDGARMRVFGVKGAWPNWVYEMTYDNIAWDSAWRQVFGEIQSVVQSSPTAVNGDVNLLTYWFGLQEQLAK